MTLQEEYDKVNSEIANLILKRDMIYELLFNETRDKKAKFRLIVEGDEYLDYLPSKYGKILEWIISDRYRGQVIEMNEVCEDLLGVKYGTFEETKEIFSYFGVDITEDDYNALKIHSKYSIDDVNELIDDVIANEVASFKIDW